MIKFLLDENVPAAIGHFLQFGGLHWLEIVMIHRQLPTFAPGSANVSVFLKSGHRYEGMDIDTAIRPLHLPKFHRSPIAP